MTKIKEEADWLFNVKAQYHKDNCVPPVSLLSTKMQINIGKHARTEGI